MYSFKDDLLFTEIWNFFFIISINIYKTLVSLRNARVQKEYERLEVDVERWAA